MQILRENSKLVFVPHFCQIHYQLKYIYIKIYMWIYIKEKKKLYKATSFKCKCTYALHISKPSCELCENLFA